ncbi:hypothetical protein K437DRAFT_151101, partial [Tilletiaria anomala UBC 951]
MQQIPSALAICIMASSYLPRLLGASAQAIAHAANHSRDGDLLGHEGTAVVILNVGPWQIPVETVRKAAHYWKQLNLVRVAWRSGLEWRSQECGKNKIVAWWASANCDKLCNKCKM